MKGSWFKIQGDEARADNLKFEIDEKSLCYEKEMRNYPK
jgi:hypothetical protein